MQFQPYQVGCTPKKAQIQYVPVPVYILPMSHQICSTMQCGCPPSVTQPKYHQERRYIQNFEDIRQADPHSLFSTCKRIKDLGLSS